MPTSAEWEYAARANTGHKYFNSGSNITNNVAWTSDNNDGDVRLVAQLKSNNYKLFDMSGNVREWCQDAATVVLHSFPQFDPISFGVLGSGIGDRYVVRGSSTFDANTMRSITFRSEVDNLDPFDHLGVRLVWEQTNKT